MRPRGRMQRRYQFWGEVLLSVGLAMGSSFLALIPPFDHFGGISLALILGVLVISAVLKRAGFEPVLATLAAVGSSICGASAIAAAGPAIRANKETSALAIVVCTLIGTIATMVAIGLQVDFSVLRKHGPNLMVTAGLAWLALFTVVLVLCLF
jgi:uncharacterized membrane protein YadS